MIFFDLVKHLQILLVLSEKLYIEEDKMALKEVSNEADYKSAISSSNLVAVHFQAPWAPECETVSAVLQVSCPPVSRGVFFSVSIYPLYQNYKMMSGTGIAEGGWTSGQA